jgi:hypothetical protein
MRANVLVQETFNQAAKQLRSSYGGKSSRVAGRANLSSNHDIVSLMKPSDMRVGTAAVNNSATTESVMNVSVHPKQQRNACQRFLERGNKVVPPNYEE